MNESSARVAQGLALATEAGSALARIQDAATRSLTCVREISCATGEQSSASQDVASHVERIAQMSEENSVSLNHMSQQARRLDQLASTTADAVAFFCL